MGLYLPSDPPDTLGDFKPLGPPIKPVPVPDSGTLEPTKTPGVLRNSKTGKLETDLPVGDSGQKRLIPFEGARPELVVIEESSEFKISMLEKIKSLKARMEEAALRDYTKHQEKPISSFQEYIDRYGLLIS